MNYKQFWPSQNVDDRRNDYINSYLPDPQRYDGQIAMQEAPAIGGFHPGLSGIPLQDSPISQLLSEQAGINDIQTGHMSPLELLMRGWKRPTTNSVLIK